MILDSHRRATWRCICHGVPLFFSSIEAWIKIPSHAVGFGMVPRFPESALVKLAKECEESCVDAVGYGKIARPRPRSSWVYFDL